MKDIDIIIQIKELELSLLSQGTRCSSDKLNSLISDDFIEFGASGRIYNKEEVLNDLPNDISRDFVVGELNAILLSEDIVLVTYKIKEWNISSLRSSIWKKNSDGIWQLFFHQGTKIYEE